MQVIEEIAMRLPLILLQSILVLAVCIPTAHARQHAAPAPAAPAPGATTPDAPRWPVDANLRRNMRAIRRAVDALGQYEHGHMTPQQAVAVAMKIQDHAADIIAQCQLPPDADAALHAVLAPLLSGAATLRQEPSRLEVIAPMREALAQYDRQFDRTREVEHAPEQH